MRIEITDNGPGLPEETLRILFDPFHVRSDSPSEFGIRLMACFFIVHQHGGKIIARSSQSQGTTFVLNIPLDPGKVSLAEENQLFLEKLIHTEEAFENHLSS
jgi:signal transduction histidine kinase